MSDDELLDESELIEEVGLETATTARDRAKLGPFRRLYAGLTTFDFVGRKRVWFTISAVIILSGMLALGFKGLNLGIDFKGGSTWTVSAPGATQQGAVNAVTPPLTVPTVEILTGINGKVTVQVQADLNGLPQAQRTKVTNQVTNKLARYATQVTGKKVFPRDVSLSFIGPSWGGQVTQKAIEALIAFFIAVVAYISIRFEPKMAIAAFLAMLHDLAVTVGIYALFGFQVTPDTVIAVLTILGYSLYDTVVVFDRIRDNTKPFAASGRMTYSAMVNLSMNQTLARSINTSMVAILPVLSVLLVGAQLLGAITLQSYGVALTVGLLSGAYSSIFIASPLLAIMKEREHRYVAVRQRLASKGDRTISMSALDAARIRIAAPAARTGSSGPRASTPAKPSTPSTSPKPAAPVSTDARAATSIPQQTAPAIAPRARKQKKR
ncbi:MAG TPA: protein translocase subunit SecF [Acidimicrobiales bacterium]|nr:protein translocase subunit SecF [Acidimicrobiales bacterium]